MTRTKRQADPEEVLVVQTLRIMDKKNAFASSQNLPSIESNLTRGPEIKETRMEHIPNHRCVEENTLISGSVIFLVIQVIILAMFVFLWKKKRENRGKEVITPPESTTDSLSYMYETGFTRRLQ